MSKPMGSLPSEPMEVMAADASESEAKVKGSRRLELKLKLKLDTYFDGGFGIRLTLLPVGMQRLLTSGCPSTTLPDRGHLG